MTAHPEIWLELIAEHDGRRVEGAYSVSDGMITVRAFGKQVTTQLSDSTPEGLARIILWEMAGEAKE